MTNFPTQNAEYGFYGTIKEQGRDPDICWQTAMTAIAEETWEEPEKIRLFLDSIHGRLFADSMEEFKTEDIASATRKTIQRWLSWSTSKTMERELGIPEGLPYLTAMLAHGAMLQENMKEK